MYIKDLMQKVGIDDKVSSVLVQTAYCNQRVTKFLKEKGIENKFCRNGVKNVHPIVANYDVGANDEPNGHGTVSADMDKINGLLEGNESVEA